ncbi:hypothetical protein SAMN04487905_1267 [Actinopolyspora xinjiangensis]|uniref:Transposase n=1 Tax=Actinopolyspora xinjiangensis TaxID=405564 RepID=A0A1H0X383_9ACTN|nr:hypothetical protein [Actinopolyspora xinjiangensis]SDP97372.1 hypothetical protein SAMN04487905_1267 [Actinopolyspora xinjiangensis]
MRLHHHRAVVVRYDRLAVCHEGTATIVAINDWFQLRKQTQWSAEINQSS